MKRCETCGATYLPTQADGADYFHACAPLAVHEIARGLKDGTIALSPEQARQLDAAQAADKADPIADGDRSRAAVYLEGLVIERPNKRDENVAGPPREGAATQPIKSAGKGARTV
jgi:hypothetical protein